MGWKKMIQYSVYTYSLNITSHSTRRCVPHICSKNLMRSHCNWCKYFMDRKDAEKQELTARKEATCFLLREAHTCSRDVHACTYSDAHMHLTLRRCSECGRIEAVSGGQRCVLFSVSAWLWLNPLSILNWILYRWNSGTKAWNFKRQRSTSTSSLAPRSQTTSKKGEMSIDFFLVCFKCQSMKCFLSVIDSSGLTLNRSQCCPCCSELFLGLYCLALLHLTRRSKCFSTIFWE